MYLFILIIVHEINDYIWGTDDERGKNSKMERAQCSAFPHPLLSTGGNSVKDLLFFPDLFLGIYIHANKTELPNRQMKYITTTKKK